MRPFHGASVGLQGARSASASSGSFEDHILFFILLILFRYFIKNITREIRELEPAGWAEKNVCVTLDVPEAAVPLAVFNENARCFRDLSSCAFRASQILRHGNRVRGPRGWCSVCVLICNPTPHAEAACGWLAMTEEC